MVRLISNARDWWKFWSMRFAAAALGVLSLAEFAPHALHSVWALLPVAVQESMPDDFLRVLGLVLIGLGMAARMVKQKGLSRD